MKRRSLFLAATGGALGLAGCTALTPAAVQTALQTDTADLAAALDTLPAELSAAGVTVPAATLADINNVISDINTNAAAIASAATTSPTSVSAIVGDITTVASLVEPFFPEAAAIVPLVDAAVSIGGTLLSEAGVSLAAAPAARKYTPRTVYAPAAARAILHAQARKAKT
jgi:hypothetical protein